MLFKKVIAPWTFAPFAGFFFCFSFFLFFCVVQAWWWHFFLRYENNVSVRCACWIWPLACYKIHLKGDLWQMTKNSIKGGTTFNLKLFSFIHFNLPENDFAFLDVSIESQQINCGTFILFWSTLLWYSFYSYNSDLHIHWWFLNGNKTISTTCALDFFLNF